MHQYILVIWSMNSIILFHIHYWSITAVQNLRPEFRLLLLLSLENLHFDYFSCYYTCELCLATTSVIRYDLFNNNNCVNTLINVSSACHLVHTWRQPGSELAIWTSATPLPSFTQQQHSDLTANAHQGGYNILPSISYTDQPKAPAVLGAAKMSHVISTVSAAALNLPH